MKHVGEREKRPTRGGAWRWRAALYACVPAAAALVLYTFDPATPGLFPPCPFPALTGLNCPGCGTLRGLHQLMHGNLAAAFRLNPLMVVTLPPVAYAAASRSLADAGRPMLPRPNFSAGWYWFYAGRSVLGLPEYALLPSRALQGLF
jgi:hypothetical protein